MMERNLTEGPIVPTDPYRELIRRKQFAIKVESLMREEAVVNYFAARGYKVLSTDENQTRNVLKMLGRPPAADVLAEVTSQRLIIAEVKGSDVHHALTQLENTARSAQGRYPYIECKIYVRTHAPATDIVDLHGGHCGYRAVRVFHSQFPGEWLLYEYDQNGMTKQVRIASQPVMIVFGPHV